LIRGCFQGGTEADKVINGHPDLFMDWLKRPHQLMPRFRKDVELFIVVWQ
jgi:hypothetical protein